MAWGTKSGSGTSGAEPSGSFGYAMSIGDRSNFGGLGSSGAARPAWGTWGTTPNSGRNGWGAGGFSDEYYRPAGVKRIVDPKTTAFNKGLQFWTNDANDASWKQFDDWQAKYDENYRKAEGSVGDYADWAKGLGNTLGKAGDDWYSKTGGISDALRKSLASNAYATRASELGALDSMRSDFGSHASTNRTRNLEQINAWAEAANKALGEYETKSAAGAALEGNRLQSRLMSAGMTNTPMASAYNAMAAQDLGARTGKEVASMRLGQENLYNPARLDTENRYGGAMMGLAERLGVARLGVEGEYGRTGRANELYLGDLGLRREDTRHNNLRSDLLTSGQALRDLPGLYERQINLSTLPLSLRQQYRAGELGALQNTANMFLGLHDIGLEAPEYGPMARPPNRGSPPGYPEPGPSYMPTQGQPTQGQGGGQPQPQRWPEPSYGWGSKGGWGDTGDTSGSNGWGVLDAQYVGPGAANVPPGVYPNEVAPGVYESVYPNEVAPGVYESVVPGGQPGQPWW